jgi:hypothetical protein
MQIDRISAAMQYFAAAQCHQRSALNSDGFPDSLVEPVPLRLEMDPEMRKTPLAAQQRQILLQGEGTIG